VVEHLSHHPKWQKFDSSHCVRDKMENEIRTAVDNSSHILVVQGLISATVVGSTREKMENANHFKADFIISKTRESSFYLLF
jgi:hypothetical protein